MLVTQLCPTLCDPIDCSPPGSSVHGTLQARILEWVTMHSSRKSSWPRDWTWNSCFAGRFFIAESLGRPINCFIQAEFFGKIKELIYFWTAPREKKKKSEFQGEALFTPFPVIHSTQGFALSIKLWIDMTCAAPEQKILGALQASLRPTVLVSLVRKAQPLWKLLL